MACCLYKISLLTADKLFTCNIKTSSHKNYQFLDHRDNTPQLEALFRCPYNKARTGCSICPNAVAASMRRSWTCRGQCIFGSRNGNSCRAVSRNHSIARPDTPCTIRLLTSNEEDRKCILTDLLLKQLFSHWEAIRFNLSNCNLLTFTCTAIMMTLLTTEIGFKETFWAFGMAFAGCQLPASRTGDALIPPGSQACFTR